MTERILAIDPGERAGWAIGEVNTAHELNVTDHGIAELKPFALKLFEVAGTYDTIVYEQYRIAADKAWEHVGSDVPTLQLIGMIRLCAWRYPDVSIVWQDRNKKSTGVKVATPQIAEILGRMPTTHDDAHDGDALMHLSFYYWNKYV